MAEKLRDLSHPIDVPLLDATVAAFYGTGSKEEVSLSLPPFLRWIFFFFLVFWSSSLSSCFDLDILGGSLGTNGVYACF